MEKIRKIESMFFIDKLTETEISKKLKVSNSYVSRVLRNNINYKKEKETRREEKRIKREIQQVHIMRRQRKNNTNNITNDKLMLQQMHNKASQQMSTVTTLSNKALRKWCSLYNYNKDKKCYEFDTEKVLKPHDFPLYIKV